MPWLLPIQTENLCLVACFFIVKSKSPLIFSSYNIIKQSGGYLKTKYARFALALNKSGTRNNVSRYIKNIPLPPLDRQWSDSTIVEHYNLTQDEWESIDSFIPDYYG